ncbi:hypothetical protein RJ55_06644 [Drechmeria coniospora]|nr:hypothetical protein RJ55_06644 [Drechmeria coniospora]
MALAPSSPRLPSPPPPAEIQIGPKSPSGSGSTVNAQSTQAELTALDALSNRRIHPGTKAADMAAGPPLVPLNELDSAFQLQEHLAALHYHHTGTGTHALTRATAMQLAQPPAGIDRTLWLYELCRFLISKCNSLIVGFLFDFPPCSAITCPEMRASEWQFLCAVHEQPKSCCAIDYSCHTLDWAANVVSDQKIFPSRFAVLNDTQSNNIGVKNLVNVFRRLHRIFAHAWFQHRAVFWTVEGQTGLYVLFKTVCDLYDLLPAENYKLPPEAEGLEGPVAEPEPEAVPPTILKPLAQQRGNEDDGFHPARTNTRRHIRSSPSTGSAVTTVLEADEDETDLVSNRMRSLDIATERAAAPAEEELKMTEMPILVEDLMPEPVTPHAISTPVAAGAGEVPGEVLGDDKTTTIFDQKQEGGNKEVTNNTVKDDVTDTVEAIGLVEKASLSDAPSAAAESNPYADPVPKSAPVSETDEWPNAKSTPAGTTAKADEMVKADPAGNDSDKLKEPMAAEELAEIL